MRLLKKIFVFLAILPVRIYQYTISPLIPGACRYTPSCSEYTAQAIHKHGPVKGIWMGIKRISTCHPWGGSGYDPVQ
ncbi:MAG TPA: membrane protein insertion efficiency factor YidD [Cytophagaceae bacterium]|nr:membrane protein insertion efficiency factor YidD [Cytophagaceae bacterium]